MPAEQEWYLVIQAEPGSGFTVRGPYTWNRARERYAILEADTRAIDVEIGRAPPDDGEFWGSPDAVPRQRGSAADAVATDGGESV